MDLFSLIRALNPTKVKTGSRPRALHEVPLLTLTTARVIEMDEPAMATDSSGVPSAIEKSPLDFAHEDEASDQGTTAPEVPQPEDVPATAVPEVLLPMSVTLIRYLLLMLRHTIPLTFPSVAAVGDPEAQNISSPAEVGSLGSVFRPEWGVTNGSLLDTPEAYQDLVDHAAPSGYFFELRHMHNADFLRQYQFSPAGGNGWLVGTKESKPGSPKKKPGSTAVDRETLKADFEEYKRKNDQLVEQRCAKMDARLDALSIDFDEELYPYMLTAIAGRRWVIGHGLCLAMMKCTESLEMRQAFADVVSARVAKGMSEGLKHGVEHGHAQLMVESLEAYDPKAEAKFAATLQSLKDLKYPLMDQLEGLKDAPMDVIIAALYLESDTRGMPHNLYATSVPATLSLPSLCTRRSDGVPVSVPTVVPQGLALLLVDAATQTDLEDV
uniref:Transposase (Putative), gypsy type n=1 Tax=Tanacetum cinerariifolium TaxID=118510 RepID=A0A699JVI3_TANCI|nr:hypothetical protein [Tanacetum cinerariifolium]